MRRLPLLFDERWRYGVAHHWDDMTYSSDRNQAPARSAHLDSPNLASLFRQLTVGVYVIGVAHGGRADAFTASSVMQVSYSPLLVLVGVNPAHAAYRLLRGGSSFCVSVLRDDQLDVAQRFGTQSTAGVDKLSGSGWHAGRGGAPILDDALAYFECEVAGEWPAGDHRLVLGQVVNGSFLDYGATPLLYSQTGNMDGSSELYPITFVGTTGRVKKTG
jgi:flavin reductase (DIM6/NTAB) family NADH-FMN oxidoreductase RutF